mgnify:CR=1 FL=1
MTPEGRTKARIKKVLAAYDCYVHMPVMTGYGRQELDFQCARKRYMSGELVWELFFIEAKAHGSDPTPLQWTTINRHRALGRKVFIIDDERDSLKPKYDSLAELKKWLDFSCEST